MTQTKLSELQSPMGGEDCLNQNTALAPAQAPQSTTNANCRSGWKADEKRALAAVTFPLIEMQKQYGRIMDPRLVMQGWEIKFAGRYAIEQLLYALNKYTDKRSDFPAPADLIAILEPEEPKVTVAEYVAAQKWQENNGYPRYSNAYDTVKRYEAQQREARQTVESIRKDVLQLAAASVKRINQIEDQSHEFTD